VDTQIHKANGHRTRTPPGELLAEDALSPMLVPVDIVGLGKLRLQTHGRLVDFSHHGIRLGVLEAIPVGAILRLESDGSVLFCEVKDCRDHQTWFDVSLTLRHRPQICDFDSRWS
jgi:hypothetical protein